MRSDDLATISRRLDSLAARVFALEEGQVTDALATLDGQGEVVAVLLRIENLLIERTGRV
jgi:hypothetical protein